MTSTRLLAIRLAKRDANNQFSNFSSVPPASLHTPLAADSGARCRARVAGARASTGGSGLTRRKPATLAWQILKDGRGSSTSHGGWTLNGFLVFD